MSYSYTFPKVNVKRYKLFKNINIQRLNIKLYLQEDQFSCSVEVSFLYCYIVSYDFTGDYSKEYSLYFLTSSPL